MKVCTKCKEEKELEEFGKDKSAKDGKYSNCKVCINAAVKARRSTPEGKASVSAANKAYRAKPENKVKQKEYNANPEVRDRINAKRNKRHSTPEGKAKTKIYYAKPEVKARQNAKRNTPEGKAKTKAWNKAYKEDQKQERIEYLMENFDKLESDVSGTIYHFKIKGLYKIGKASYGFDSRYCKQVQEDATQITEWIMNEKQMDKLEKIILAKTKDTQYAGDNVLPSTGNREVRTNDNEQLIDDLLAELNVDYIKIKR